MQLGLLRKTKTAVVAISLSAHLLWQQLSQWLFIIPDSSWLVASALLCLSNCRFLHPKAVSCSDTVVFAKCLVPSKRAGTGSACTGLQFFILYFTANICVPPPFEILFACVGKEKCCGQPKWLCWLDEFPSILAWEIPGISRDEKFLSEKDGQKLCTFWRTPVSTEVVFCLSRVVFKTWNLEHGVMKERSGSGLEISVMEYSPVKIYTVFLCSLYLRIINPNIINAQRTN